MTPIIFIGEYSQAALDEWQGPIPPLCFVLTHSCQSISDPPPCQEDDFGHIFLSNLFTKCSHHFHHHEWGSWRSNLGYTLSTQFGLGSCNRGDLQHVLLKDAVSPEDNEVALRASAFIYVAPCERLISQAIIICHEASGASRFLWHLVRVDDRLKASCCQSGMGHNRLVSLLHCHGKEQRQNLYFNQHLDRKWLEQRIHEIEEEERQFIPSHDPTTRFSYSFQPESYSPWEILAGIVHVGEEAQIREIMAPDPFPQHSHIPSAKESFAIHRDLSGVYTRRFLGKYRRNPGLIKRKGRQPEVLTEHVWPLPMSMSSLDMPTWMGPLAKRGNVSDDGSLHDQQSEPPDGSQAPLFPPDSVSNANQPVPIR